MKILVICQHYSPEPFRIADICEQLVIRGHNVTVVTGTPNYPMGEIYPGYEGKDKRDETINGVQVHRCPIHPRKTGAIHRLWNYYSFSYQSSRYIKTLDDSYDVVFINQLSPVMMANAGLRYAKKHNKKIVLYCLDLWPASISVGGVSGGPVYKWFYRESKKIYRSVQKILVSSQSFSDYFEEQFGIKEIGYLPQYAEDTFTPAECRKEPDAFIDLMFAGNVGTAQSVKTIVQAAALCKDMPQVRWHIVGDGKELENVKALAADLDVPITFYGRRPIEEMPRFYAMADAMLVTMQKEPVISLTLPGKVQSYMAAGKPIIGAIDGETANVIVVSSCGLCGEAENADALAHNVREFVHAEKEVFGHRSRAYYEQYFQKDVFMDKLIYELQAQCEGAKQNALSAALSE